MTDPELADLEFASRRERGVTWNAPVLAPSDMTRIDGIPGEYNDGITWLRAGLLRQRLPVLVSLVLAWTGIWIALWGAAIGAVIGSLVGLNVVAGSTAGGDFSHIGGGQAITAVSVIGGFFLGLVWGFVLVVKAILVENPIAGVVSVASGAVIAVTITVLMASLERLSLRLRGYRRLSRDEVRRIAVLVKDLADQMDLDALPRFAMSDSLVPGAWTHMRTIVLTGGLLAMLDDDEVTAILAHELHHWRTGDAVALRMIWAASWPIALVLDLGMWLARGNITPKEGRPPSVVIRLTGLLTIMGWGLAWPAWIMMRLVIAPLSAAASRRYEYEADAAAAQIGHATKLSSALRKIGSFETPRTGWEQTMVATHPPLELRLEALQSPRPDDDEYQELALRGPTLRDLAHLFGGLIAPRGLGASTPPAQPEPPPTPDASRNSRSAPTKATAPAQRRKPTAAKQPSPTKRAPRQGPATRSP